MADVLNADEAHNLFELAVALVTLAQSGWLAEAGCNTDTLDTQQCTRDSEITIRW
jgi:hypothetical protein